MLLGQLPADFKEDLNLGLRMRLALDMPLCAIGIMKDETGGSFGIPKCMKEGSHLSTRLPIVGMAMIANIEVTIIVASQNDHPRSRRN